MPRARAILRIAVFEEKTTLADEANRASREPLPLVAKTTLAEVARFLLAARTVEEETTAVAKALSCRTGVLDADALTTTVAAVRRLACLAPAAAIRKTTLEVA